MKNSNIISSKISVKIYDGLTLICGSDNFDSVQAARDSAKRIIEHQKKLIPSNTAYAMVFQGKQMLYYFD